MWISWIENLLKGRRRYIIKDHIHFIILINVATLGCHHSSFHLIFELWAMSDSISQFITPVSFDLAQVPWLRPRPPALQSFAALSFATITYGHCQSWVAIWTRNSIFSSEDLVLEKYRSNFIHLGHVLLYKKSSRQKFKRREKLRKQDQCPSFFSILSSTPRKSLRIWKLLRCSARCPSLICS